jgi:hypothetical protein
MSWLTPLTGLILALAVIPPLILLYFLKLRRRSQAVASTLLWKKSIEDLRANAPFQKLRRSVLLLLQLIALALLVLAVMQPRLHAGNQRGGRAIILIDNSASMAANDSDDGDRLSEAKRRAKDRIESMFVGGLFSRPPGETMVIAFSDRAEIRCRFTDSKQQLLAAIDSIEPTHGESRIEDALKLARAYTINPDPDSDRPVGAPAAIDLFSDGQIQDLDSQVLRGERMVFHPVGTAGADNVAITSISVDRPYDQPTAVEVFAALLNFNIEPVVCDIQISVDGVVRSVLEVQIPAAEVNEAINTLLPGRKNVVFLPFDQPRGAVIEIANLRRDDLAADNVAQIVVPPPKKLRVGLVAPGRSLLKVALEGLALEDLVLLSPSRYETLAGAGQLDEYDVVVFDGYTPTLMPPGRYLSFGQTPPLEGLNDFGEGQGQVMLAWKAEHPALQFASLDKVFIAKSRLLEPADDIEVLAETNDGAAIVAISRGPMQAVHVTFDPLESNWPYHRSFVTFVYNAIDFLGHSGEALSSKGFRPGEAITARLPDDATDVQISVPDPVSTDGAVTKRPASDDPAQLSWGPTRLSGLHVISWISSQDDERQRKAVAVNLLSQAEGQISVIPTIELGAETVSGEMGRNSAYTPLWPYALTFFLAVITLEWWVYHRKAYV